MPSYSRQGMLKNAVLPAGGTYAMVRFLASEFAAQEIAVAIAADPQARSYVKATEVSAGTIGWVLRVCVRASASDEGMGRVAKALRNIVRLEHIVAVQD